MPVFALGGKSMGAAMVGVALATFASLVGAGMVG
jgi:hypothetical protein